MKKNHKKITKAIKKTIVGVFICTMGILLCLPDESISASAKDQKQQTVAPSPTQKPSKTAPSTTTAPPSNKMLKSVPKIHKDLAVQDLIVTPNEFSIGERTIVVFDIHNLGQTRISQVSYVVVIKINAPPWHRHTLFSDTLRNLSPGSITGVKREVTIPQSLSAGRGNIEAAIVSSFNDDNTVNNYATKSVTIRQGPSPNLFIDYWRVINRHSEPLRAGSLFDIEFRVRNNGQMESVPCKYNVKTERHRLWGWVLVEERSYDIYPIRPHEFMDASPTFQIPEDLPAGQDLRITIYVDSTNQISEIHEQDNKRVIKVHY